MRMEIKRAELRKESVPGEEKVLGEYFHLRGGKADNMTNILTNMKHIHKYLDEEYLPDQDIYKQFLKHYEEVKAIRTKIQKFADSIRAYQEYSQKLEQVRANYQKELENKENELCAELQKLAEIEQECRKRLEQLQSCLKETQNRAETIRQNMTSMNQCLQVHKRQCPCFFSGKKKEEKYRSRLNEITAQLVKLSDEYTEHSNQEKEINNNILLWQAKLRRSTEKQTELQRKFASWKMAEAGKISNLEKRVYEYENIRNDSETEPLNMNQEYDDLQKSNPWFDEAYRVAQSKLFVMALRVRKQFLYENRKKYKGDHYCLGSSGEIFGEKNL